MKHKGIALIAMLLMICLLAACGAPAQPEAAETPQPAVIDLTVEEPQAEETPAPAPEQTAASTPEPTPEPTPEVALSNTSGKPVDASVPYRPVIVSIENAAAARPQTGLMNADIVYEFLVESHITRFQALFSDDVPSYVGPVRSARYYFIDLQQEWNGMYAHIGYTRLSGKYSRGWDNCAIHISGGEHFWRIQQDGVASEHTMYLHLQDLVNAEYGDHRPNRDERFLFEAGVAYDGAQQVSRVDVPFTTKTDIYYTYDAATGRMLRFQDGKAFMVRTPNDAGSYTSEQVAVNNLIIQHCTYGMVPASAQPGENKGRRSVELTGTGACEYIINGQLMTGTWERATLNDFTRYYLADGSLVTLEPGNTWIEVIPNNQEIKIS